MLPQEAYSSGSALLRVRPADQRRPPPKPCENPARLRAVTTCSEAVSAGGFARPVPDIEPGP
jgi:hypothetical protein